MKKQYKLYYYTTFSPDFGIEIVKSDIGVCKLRGGFRVTRVDVCTCDNIYTAKMLCNIIDDSLNLTVRIEEVEDEDYEETPT